MPTEIVCQEAGGVKARRTQRKKIKLLKKIKLQLCSQELGIPTWVTCDSASSVSD